MGLNLEDFLLSDKFDVINEGNIAEQFVGLELIKVRIMLSEPYFYYWHRGSKKQQCFWKLIMFYRFLRK